MKSKSLNLKSEKTKEIKKTKSSSSVKPTKKSNSKINTFDQFIEHLLKFNLLEKDARQKMKNDDIPFRLNIPINIINILCLKTYDLFSKEPNLLELEAPFHIFGDIHGQYNDLIRFFELVDLPPKNKFLFLGDYVDRGENSLEVVSLLFSLKIKFPNNIYLIRGNHECSDLNGGYGFKDECIDRYGKEGISIWKEINKSFQMLPICGLLNEKIFCVHGGISPKINNLKEINCINRNCTIPNDGIMCDLTWGDPKKQKTEWADNDRGCSYTFNEKAIDDFMKKLDLDLIIRAHQVVDRGYQFFNDRKLVTVFSAPNYCGDVGNYASIMNITKDLECSFITLKPTSKKKTKHLSKSVSKQ
jgi:serine/threonine-protein phosphatase PP1 catalytic subunit